MNEARGKWYPSRLDATNAQGNKVSTTHRYQNLLDDNLLIRVYMEFYHTETHNSCMSRWRNQLLHLYRHQLHEIQNNSTGLPSGIVIE